MPSFIREEKKAAILYHYNEQISMTSRYPGFDYQPDKLSKFIAATDIFTILLKNGEIIHFVPADKVSFYKWLIHHKIEDIKFDNKIRRNETKNGMK